MAAGMLGLKEEKREAVAWMNDIYPAFTIARHMRIMPFRDEAEAARLATYLRKAGLPE